MKITCSKCGQLYEVEDDMEGQVCKCVVCNSNFVVGRRAAPPPLGTPATLANYSGASRQNKPSVTPMILFIIGWVVLNVPCRIIGMLYHQITKVLDWNVASFIVNGADIIFILLATWLFLWSFILTRRRTPMSIWQILSVVYLFNCAASFLRSICNIISPYLRSL